MPSFTATNPISQPTPLQDCVNVLTGNYEGTISFLDTYLHVLNMRINFNWKLSWESPYAPITERNARREWDIMANAWIAADTNVRLPSFDAIWTEANSLLHAYCAFKRVTPDWFQFWWDEVEVYLGLPCRKTVVAIFDDLRGSQSNDICSWATEILNAQPRFIDSSDNLRFLSNYRANASPDVTPYLHLIMRSTNMEKEEVESLIHHFGSITLTAVNYYLSYADNGLQQFVDNDIPPLIRAHRAVVSDPLSKMRITLRQELAGIDLRGTFRLFLHDAVALGTSHPRNELRSRIFHKFVRGVLLSAANRACLPHVQAALAKLGLTQFECPTMLPIRGWEPLAFDDYLYLNEYDEDSDYDNLSDTYLEPVGPDLKVEYHAVAVTSSFDLPEPDCSICLDALDVRFTKLEQAPVKVKCGHCFHYECLATLINGISEFSNLCPNCRDEICARRRRRCKDEDEQATAAPQGGSGHDDVASERAPGLRDKQGDVVMTEPGDE